MPPRPAQRGRRGGNVLRLQAGIARHHSIGAAMSGILHIIFAQAFQPHPLFGRGLHHGLFAALHAGLDPDDVREVPFP